MVFSLFFRYLLRCLSHIVPPKSTQLIELVNPVVEVRLGSFLFASQTNRTFTTGFTLLSFSEKNFGGFARPSFLKENFGGFALLGFSPKNLGLLRPTTPQSPTCAQEFMALPVTALTSAHQADQNAFQRLHLYRRAR